MKLISFLDQICIPLYFHPKFTTNVGKTSCRILTILYYTFIGSALEKIHKILPLNTMNMKSAKILTGPPDLAPPDFVLWGFSKSKVCSNKPEYFKQPLRQMITICIVGKTGDLIPKDKRHIQYNGIYQNSSIELTDQLTMYNAVKRQTICNGKPKPQK